MSAADGGLAFPCVSHGGVADHQVFEPGMTLRDYFAAKALPALIDVCQSDARAEGLSFPEHIAACAYGLADAMLQARQAKPSTEECDCHEP